MNRFAPSTPLRAGAVAACLAAAGLVLAACGTAGNGPTSGSNPSSPSSSPSGKSSGSGSGTSNSGTSSVVSSNSVPFPIAVGNTWVYKQVIGGSGTRTDRISAITAVAGGERVTMGHGYYIFHPDGSITYPFSQIESSDVQVKLAKGSLEWPPASVINSGQPTKSTLEIDFILAGKTNTETAHVTVQGEGTQTVTVPAGTYSATIVDMNEIFTILGHTGDIEVKTWVANGVGPVQSEAITTVGGTHDIVSKQELVSFTKG